MSPRVPKVPAAKRRGPRPMAESMASLHIRVPADALERWRSAAESAGLDLSTWVRGVLDRSVSVPDAAMAWAKMTRRVQQLERILEQIRRISDSVVAVG